MYNQLEIASGIHSAWLCIKTCYNNTRNGIISGRCFTTASPACNHRLIIRNATVVLRLLRGIRLVLRFFFWIVFRVLRGFLLFQCFYVNILCCLILLLSIIAGYLKRKFVILFTGICTYHQIIQLCFHGLAHWDIYWRKFIIHICYLKRPCRSIINNGRYFNILRIRGTLILKLYQQFLLFVSFRINRGLL